MMWFWDQYLPDPTVRDNQLALLLRADSLAGLPPAITVVAEHDPLRDSGLSYYARLSEGGVPVRSAYFDELPHGFLSLVGLVARADRAVAKIGQGDRALTEGIEAPRSFLPWLLCAYFVVDNFSIRLVTPGPEVGCAQDSRPIARRPAREGGDP